MIIFLHGPDSYRRTARKKFYFEAFIKKHGPGGVGAFSFAEEGGLEHARLFLESQSLFGGAKLAVLGEAFEAESAPLAETLRTFLEEKTIHILISEEKKPPKGLAFLLGDSVKVEAYPFLEGVDWNKFVAQEARERNASLSPEALQFLSRAYEKDAWRLVTELEKLSQMKAVGIRELEALGTDIPPNYWSLMGALRSRSVRERLAALEALFQTNDPPQKIFYMLSSFMTEEAARFAAWDRGIKLGKLDYEEALVDFAIR